jgi:Fe-Mn family superoxide dismutase
METKKHELPALPYAYDALESYISKEIMVLHHDKHHQSYIDNLNKALESHVDLQEKAAEELIANLDDIPEDIRAAVRNNAGGHVNHSMFWQIMGPNAGGEPTGELAEAINNTFGSFTDFQAKFNDAGAKRFGSGWVWLVKTKAGELEIMSTANQDNPLSEGLIPVMGNDVWEHAYYLQYKNVRMDYLKAWWNVVNWRAVEQRFLNLK